MWIEVRQSVRKGRRMETRLLLVNPQACYLAPNILELHNFGCLRTADLGFYQVLSVWDESGSVY